MRAFTLRTIMGIVFLWSGLVLGISFLEAWLKFKAPHITLPLGLGIGRLVFAASNTVQIILAILLLSLAFWQKIKLNYGVIIAISILILHTCWLLPVLDKNAELVIKYGHATHSYAHLLFVGTEVVKLVSLLIAGYQFPAEKSKTGIS